MSPIGDTHAEVCNVALSLCERGRWREAQGLLTDAGTEPEAAMVRGCVLYFTEPNAAKDALSRALRSLPDGEMKDKGNIWLATSYWAMGEAREAKAVLESVEPSSDSIRFLLGLNASIFEATKLKASLGMLSAVDGLVDSVPHLYKAKFFLQRGWLMRRLKNPDAAIIDYEAAKFWFEKSDAPRYLAVAANNLAGLLIDTNRLEDAHQAVDSALNALPDSDSLYRAQSYDQKASIFIAEKKYVEAEAFAGLSVSLLSDTENKAILAESLITHAKALRQLNRYMDALNDLEKAKGIAGYLGNKSILLAVVKEQKETAHTFTQSAHVELVETALDLSGDSLRGAARLVGVKVQPLDRFIRLHKIKRHPRVRKSIITKSDKQLVSQRRKSNKRP